MFCYDRRADRRDESRTGLRFGPQNFVTRYVESLSDPHPIMREFTQLSNGKGDARKAGKDGGNTVLFLF